MIAFKTYSWENWMNSTADAFVNRNKVYMGHGDDGSSHKPAQIEAS